MFELYVVACLIGAAGSGAECRDFTLGQDLNAPTQFQMQVELAKWAEAHQGWRVTRYGTRRLGRMART